MLLRLEILIAMVPQHHKERLWGIDILMNEESLEFPIFFSSAPKRERETWILVDVGSTQRNEKKNIRTRTSIMTKRNARWPVKHWSVCPIDEGQWDYYTSFLRSTLFLCRFAHPIWYANGRSTWKRAYPALETTRAFPCRINSYYYSSAASREAQ